MGWGGNDKIIGGPGNDRLWGDSGNDIIKGKSGDDYLDGGSGTDVLKGNRGNDWLDGGDGDDILNGGVGADVFFLSKGNDIIEDYSTLEDSKIRIDADVFTEVSFSVGSLNGQETLTLMHEHGSTLLMGIDNSSFIITDNLSFT